MFLDEANITIRAGRGGDGAIAFRRVKYVPNGGPDGGDGGHGGSVYLRANQNENTLYRFASTRMFEAQKGKSGGGQDMSGHGGEDVFVDVPVGTVVYENGEKIADLDVAGKVWLAGRGGIGGKGNAGFKTATRQAPRFAELGEPGETRELHLELKLVGDVGIIGLPSAGKSTLISVISSARPKIAAYHFTTLVPNLGVVSHRGETFVATDMPGLIKGASKGKGLGYQFLRHAERVRFFIHLIDCTSETVVADYRVIRGELTKYSKELAAKPEIVVLSKTDLLQPDELAAVQKKLAKAAKVEVLTLSAPTHAGLTDVLDRAVQLIQKFKVDTPTVVEATPIYRPHLTPKPQNFVATRKNKKHYFVDGPRINQMATMTDVKNPEAVARIFDVFEKFGIARELRKLGAGEGSTIEIAGRKFEWLF